MYPSDYLYTYASGVDNICFTSGCLGGSNTGMGWMFSNGEWTISSLSRIHWNGRYITDMGAPGTASLPYPARPCVYLRSDIEVIGGDGSSPESAYILKES